MARSGSVGLWRTKRNGPSSMRERTPALAPLRSLTQLISHTPPRTRNHARTPIKSRNTREDTPDTPVHHVFSGRNPKVFSRIHSEYPHTVDPRNAANATTATTDITVIPTVYHVFIFSE